MDEFLRSVLLFTNLPDEDLNRLSQMVETVEIQAGTQLFTEGSEGDCAYIIKEGQIEVFKMAGGQRILLSVLKPGDILGEMSLVEKGARTASARARTDSLLLNISREQFNQLLQTSSAAALAMLHTIIARLRSTERLLQQNEKMAQLGTLTSSVAHELNGPVATTKRRADQLREFVEQLAPLQLKLFQLQLTESQLDLLFRLEKQLLRQARRPVKIDPSEQRVLRHDMAVALENFGIKEAANLAQVLINLGYEANKLKPLTESFNVEQLTICLSWLDKISQIYGLLDNIGRGVTRISGIVEALKTYSDLDQTSPEQVNIQDELEEAIIALRKQLKSGVTIQRHYAKELPEIRGYSDELCQVFVNIIDNAIDAMNGYGLINLRTYQENGYVAVEIEDNGPGVPADIQNKIFEPFFTTKPPGDGMGMGLHICQKIVVQKHRGQLAVHSGLNGASFVVKLPLNFEGEP